MDLSHPFPNPLKLCLCSIIIFTLKNRYYKHTILKSGTSTKDLSVKCPSPIPGPSPSIYLVLARCQALC